MPEDLAPGYDFRRRLEDFLNDRPSQPGPYTPGDMPRDDLLDAIFRFRCDLPGEGPSTPPRVVTLEEILEERFGRTPSLPTRPRNRKTPKRNGRATCPRSDRRVRLPALRRGIRAGCALPPPVRPGVECYAPCGSSPPRARRTFASGNREFVLYCTNGSTPTGPIQPPRDTEQYLREDLQCRKTELPDLISLEKFWTAETGFPARQSRQCRRGGRWKSF